MAGWLSGVGGHRGRSAPGGRLPAGTRRDVDGVLATVPACCTAAPRKSRHGLTQLTVNPPVTDDHSQGKAHRRRVTRWAHPQPAVGRRVTPFNSGCLRTRRCPRSRPRSPSQWAPRTSICAGRHTPAHRRPAVGLPGRRTAAVRGGGGILDGKHGGILPLADGCGAPGWLVAPRDCTVPRTAARAASQGPLWRSEVKGRTCRGRTPRRVPPSCPLVHSSPGHQSGRVDATGVRARAADRPRSWRRSRGLLPPRLPPRGA